jgi:hypothetical protein
MIPRDVEQCLARCMFSHGTGHSSSVLLVPSPPLTRSNFDCCDAQLASEMGQGLPLRPG